MVDIIRSIVCFQAIPHVAAWRGSEDKSVWSLVAGLWRKEERSMGVPREYMDTLAGMYCTLAGSCYL